MIESKKANKDIILGTALWGWGVTRAESFRMLEEFLEKGGVIVDTATNYPINKCSEDQGLAIKWLSEWTRRHPNNRFSLIVKLGSTNNLGNPDSDLSKKNIIDSTERLLGIFGPALSCVSIHWDNRVDESIELVTIKQTVDAMQKVREYGLEIGLSGIKDPKSYFFSNPSLSADWMIQVKENLFTASDRSRYRPFFPSSRYFAYGINMGGVKLGGYTTQNSIKLRGIKIDSDTIENLRRLLETANRIAPSKIDFYQLSLAFAYLNESLSGVIIGPRNAGQLVDTLKFWGSLQKRDNELMWSNLFHSLINVR